MKSFWTLNTIDKCKALARLVQSLSRANLTSLHMLSAARGESPEQVWTRCCLEAGVEPCAVPYQLLGGPERVPETVEVPRDTEGYALRSKALAELRRSGPLRTRNLRAHSHRFV